MSAFAGFSSHALASGFTNPFPSITDLGTDNAGGAALAQDASTAYTNSAGLTRLHNQQLVLSALGVTSSIKFSGTMNNPGLGLPTSETGSSSSHGAFVIPAFFYAKPLADRWTFGLSVNSPFGFGDNYSENAITRYDIVYSKLFALDIGPSIAYKLTDKLSAGAGPDAVYFSLYSQSMVRTQPLTPQDSQSKMDLSSWGYGWHGGLIYEFTPQTRAGLAYHSQVIEQLQGTSKLYANGGAPFVPNYTVSSNTQSTLPLPPITTLSVYHDFCNRWAIMSSLNYEQWSIYKHDRVFNLAGAPTNPTLVPRDWNDTWHYSLGTTYQLSPKWLLRAGAGYETGPVDNTATRNMVDPDVGAAALAIGAHFQASKTIGFDGGYAHNFFFDSKINTTNPNTGNQLIGNSKFSADALGLQMVWDL